MEALAMRALALALRNGPQKFDAMAVSRLNIIPIHQKPRLIMVCSPGAVDKLSLGSLPVFYME